MRANKIAGFSAGAFRIIDKSWNKKRKKGNK
jgi:hypothetical protein